MARQRAGLVGADGATHAGASDVSFLANLPGFVVMAAGDEADLVEMVATAAAHDAGPGVADARFAKPLDTDLIGQLARHHRLLITVEQGAMGALVPWFCNIWPTAGVWMAG